MSWPASLYPTLTHRVMPERVAAIILDDPGAYGYFSQAEVRALAGPAEYGNRYTSMSEDFERPPDCTVQADSACRMFGVPVPAGFDPGSLASVAQLIDELGGPLGWRHGMDWKTDRLPRARRGPGTVPLALIGHRAYNRHVRTLRHLWDKAVRMQAALDFRRLVLIGRSGFAVDLPEDRFLADPGAAAFTAYWTARKNTRRQFSLTGRDNPFDDTCAALLGRCKRNPGTDWAMIAEVYPKPDVLARIGDEPLGNLTARWWRTMADCAAILGGIWAELETAQRTWAARKHVRDAYRPRDIDRTRMVVHAGMDSSSWNVTVQAYNAARAGWLGCVSAGGFGRLAVPCLPPKAMRLMAADLAYWHETSTGSAAHPDALVAADLPQPWEVVTGTAVCTAGATERACRAHGLDPLATGWTAPLPNRGRGTFRLTPDLVHGVTIGDPVWAGLLRKAGVFSGKALSGDRAADAMMLRAQAQRAGMIESDLPAMHGIP
jgi:hypothetical protein